MWSSSPSLAQRSFHSGGIRFVVTFLVQSGSRCKAHQAEGTCIATSMSDYLKSSAKSADDTLFTFCGQLLTHISGFNTKRSNMKIGAFHFIEG